MSPVVMVWLPNRTAGCIGFVSGVCEQRDADLWRSFGARTVSGNDPDCVACLRAHVSLQLVQTAAGANFVRSENVPRMVVRFEAEQCLTR